MHASLFDWCLQLKHQSYGQSRLLLLAHDYTNTLYMSNMHYIQLYMSLYE